MIKHKINILSGSRYPVDRGVIRTAASQVLAASRLARAAELSVSIVGDRKMRRLNKEYCGKEYSTPVLVFAQLDVSREDVKFPQCPNTPLLLGDVVISYPLVRRLAKEQDKLVDEVLAELVKHGVKTLLHVE